MDSNAQTTQAPKQTRDTTPRDADAGQQMRAAAAASRESRVTEPAVATDGQIVEAGYGHGV